MARDFGPLVGAHVDDAGVMLEISSGGLLFLGLIIMSLSIISMVIFACDDGYSGSPRKSGGGGRAAAASAASAASAAAAAGTPSGC